MRLSSLARIWLLNNSTHIAALVRIPAFQQETQPQEEEAPTGTGIVLKRRGASKPAAQPTAPKGNDLTALRTSIQTLCQSALPLGKSMDYLQEDLENMKKELKFWINEYKLYQAKLAEQQRYTDDLLNPEV